MIAAIGTAPTVIADCPAVPPTVALTVAAPWATAVTIPEPLTVAEGGFELAHAVALPPNATPLIAFPAESRGTALSWTVCGGVRLAAGGVTVTAATGTRSMVTLAVPSMPSHVALITTAPVETPVTVPVTASTVAIDWFDDVHTIVRPVSGWPAPSSGVAEKVREYVAPACTVAGAGVTTTETTGWLITVSCAVAWAGVACPGVVTVSVIVTTPTATPVATPAVLTVANAALLVDHARVRPVGDSGSPPASKRLAVKFTTCPT